MKRNYIPLLLCVLLMGVGCVEEKLIDFTVDTGKPLRVSLEIRVPSADVANHTSDSKAAGFGIESLVDKSKGFRVNLQPRALNSDSMLLTKAGGRYKLYNFWIFQFDTDGKRKTVTKMSDTPEPVKDLIVIDTELHSGKDQTIYLVALGSEYSEIDLSGLTTKDELESYALPAFKADNSPYVTTIGQMPYCGSYDGLNIAEDSNGRGYLLFSDNVPFTGGIPMKAMLASVSVDLSIQEAAITEQYILLNKMAKTYPIKPSANYKPTEFGTMKVLFDPANKTADGRYQFTWYIAPNPQGKVPTIDRQEKRVRAFNFLDPAHPGGVWVGEAPDDGSHMVIWAKHKTENRFVLYHLFFGTNLSDDFNVWPGSSYTLRTDIDAFDSPDDLRILSAPLTQSLFFRSSETKGTPNSSWVRVNGDNNFGSDRYDLDVHPCRRPIEIFVLSGDVKIEVTNGADWLHLSAYPNYTEAKQAQIAGKQDGLTNQISVHADIPTYYKFYVYADEKKTYITESINSSNYKRRANLKFDIANVDGTGTSSVATYIDQRSGFLVGKMGGDFDYTTGQYSEYLAFEAIPEHYEHTGSNIKLPYFLGDYLPYYPTHKKMYTAIFNSNPRSWTWSQEKSFYDLGDMFNGKKATRLLAEGKNGIWWSAITLDPLAKEAESPKYTSDGKLDLYQYQDRYIVEDGVFPQRACFDRNRDDNGNGVIDEDEYHWYTPAFSQLHIATAFNMRGSTPYKDANFDNSISTTSQHQYSLTLGPLFSTVGSSTNKTARCVRNLPVSTPQAAKSPSQPKIEVVTNSEDGEKYVLIDASGLRSGNSTSQYTNYNKANGDRKNEFVYDAGAAGVRTLRHTNSDNSIAREVVSTKFIVAPTNVYPHGATWAQSAGWDNTANGTYLDSDKTHTADTGCAAYQGRTGKDKKGTWRMPNLMELLMINLYQQVLSTHAYETGYTVLNLEGSYWTATESANRSTPKKYDRAYLFRPYYDQGDTFRNMHYTTTFDKSKTNLSNGAGPLYVRCIKDIP